MSLRIFRLERMTATHGPGLRTAVFLKGCPMACRWCAYPEGIHQRVQVLWDGALCMGCERCIAVCDENALTSENGQIRLAPRLCNVCRKCVGVCPVRALRSVGTDYTIDELLPMLLRDRPFFGRSGGVTLTGGEPLLQGEAAALLSRLKRESVHTAVETCGMLFPQQLEPALPFTDLLIFDLKLADDRAHRLVTGQGVSLIRRNLALAAERMRDHGTLILRTPLIPGVTDTAENIRAIGGLLRAVKTVPRWELVRFDDTCRQKYADMGLAFPFPHDAETDFDTLLAAARASSDIADIRLVRI